MIILGIESSCDDTSVALLDCSEQGCFIISEKTASQIDIHKKYGGVVPELAGREHAEKIIPLVESILEKQTKPDLISVTSGPGLITGLLVGVEATKTLSYIWDVPLVAVNHIEGHICSVEIPNDKCQMTNKPIEYPALALIASGGHTELIYIPEQGKYKRIGATRDDAAGECFDKIAKLIGYPYPGGPEISKLAETGNPKIIDFPRPMLNQDNFDFSFSGLKTAALYWLQKNVIARSDVGATWQSRGFKFALTPRDCHVVPMRIGTPRNDTSINDFCASFEQSIVDVLVAKTIKAAQKYKPKTIILAGGVSANKKLRIILKKSISKNCPKSKFQVPNPKYTMDNAAMIAVAGYYHALKNDFTDWKNVVVDPTARIT